MALYKPHEFDAEAMLAALQHPVLPFLRDHHMTTVLPLADQAWPDEWAEPIEKMQEKQADMWAAGVRVRSQRSTLPLCAWTISVATTKSRPLSRKSELLCSERSVSGILSL